MELRLSSSQLRRAATIQERIEQLERELNQMLGSSGGATARAGQRASSSGNTSRQRRGGGGRSGSISSAGRARIAEAQRKRWASYRKQSGKSKPKSNVANLSKGKRRFSRSGLNRIAEAQKRRWANYRTQHQAGATA
jgi:hypothetical protein